MSRFKHGWRALLIKAVAAVIFIFVIELLLEAITNQDAALKPFHNHYFSFSAHYLTTPGLGSELTGDPSATVRFIIYFILGYLGYAVISILVSLILKARAGMINSVLFYAMATGCFLKAFFFPPMMSVIDVSKKEIRKTTYSWLFVPSTKHIPFSEAKYIQYGLSSDYDGYNKEHVAYAAIFITDREVSKITLGEIEVGKQKGSLSNKPVMEMSAESKAVGGAAASYLEKLTR